MCLLCSFCLISRGHGCAREKRELRAPSLGEFEKTPRRHPLTAGAGHRGTPNLSAIYRSVFETLRTTAAVRRAAYKVLLCVLPAVKDSKIPLRPPSVSKSAVASKSVWVMSRLHHRRAGLLPAFRPTALLLCLAVPSTRPFVLTPVVMSSTPREGRPFSTRQLNIGDRPAPFETMSSSGPTVEAAIRSLREAVADESQVSEGTGGGTRTAMGLLFYTRCDGDGERDVPGGHRHVLEEKGPGSSGVREELSQLHGRLPFVDHIIGEPTSRKKKKNARVPRVRVWHTRTCRDIMHATSRVFPTLQRS